MNIVAALLLTVALHGVLLMIAAAIVDRVFALRSASRELLWRAALFGGVLTATLQFASGQLPLATRWHWSNTPVVATLPSTATYMPVENAVSQSPQIQANQAGTVVEISDAPQLARVHFSLPATVLMTWSLGALLMLSRTTFRWQRLRRTLARVDPLNDDALNTSLAAIARAACSAPPRLFTLDPLASPIALHGNRIVLPAWAVASLDHDQLRAMLAHETAHLARRDPRWKMAIVVWTSIFWFVPSRYAQRRLDELAELACDAFAAHCLGDPRGLAECLAVCAEHHVGAVTFHFAPAMAARPSSLWIRIDRLLEGVAMDTTPSGIGARMIALSVLITCAFALPAIGVDQDSARAASLSVASASSHSHSSDGHGSLGIQTDGGSGHSTTLVTFSDDTRNVMANIDGKMTLNADETDISTLSERGTAKLEESKDGVTQRIELTEHDGNLQRHYFIDKAEQPYDQKARAFMAHIVTELARSGIDADVRAKRLYTEGGARRVLDEIALLHSSYAGSIYLRTLLDQGALKPDELDRAIAIAGNFDSDYERHQSLSHVIDTQSLDAQRQIAVLHQVAKMKTDYDRAEVLVQIAAQLVDAAPVRQAWLDAAKDLKTDYDRRRSYEALLAHGGANVAQIATVIDASASVHSDYDHGELLKSAAKQTRDGEAIAGIYAKSADTLGSDYNRREALMALMAADHFGPRAADAVLDGAARIQSSYDRAQVLIALARVMPLDDQHVTRYRDLAAQLPQSDRNKVENALVF